MRALVTGGNGFVGGYLVAELRHRGIDTFVAGHTLDGLDVDAPLDLSDTDNVRGVVELARPDVVFHLAAQAFVPEATAHPMATYDTNVLGTARLVDALRASPETLRTKLVFISSGEVYGAHAPSKLPLRETSLVRPATPYAASKAAGEAIVLASVQTYGLQAVVTRAFNHIGPGQSDRFVVARFAKRLAEIAAGGDPLFLVGNLEAQRDFLDVRDVAHAYADLALHGVAGEIYNVCSGTPTKIADILRTLVTIARVGVEIREDPKLMRAADTVLAYGDASKLRAATGWAPTLPLARSLRDTYDAARGAIGRRMTAAYVEMFGGASGNMLLGALLDAGADLAALEAALHTIPVSGWSIERRRVLKCGIAAEYFDFVIPGGRPLRARAYRACKGPTGGTSPTCSRSSTRAD